MLPFSSVRCQLLPVRLFIPSFFYARPGPGRGYGRTLAPHAHRDYVECILSYPPQFAMVIYPVFGLVSAAES